jgi:hypothetical protein
MAFKVTLPDDIIRQLSRLGAHTGDIIEKVLIAGAEPVRDKVKSNLKGVIGKGTKNPSRSTGDLLDSLGVSPIGMDDKGVYDVKVGFAGNRSGRLHFTPKGDKRRIYVRKKHTELPRYEDYRTNAFVANVLEYGKSDQPAKSFMKPAVSATRAASIAAMNAAFDEEVRKL